MATITPPSVHISASHVPGARPLFGGYLNLIHLVRDPVAVMGKLFARYGPVASMAAGARVALFTPLPNPGEVVFVKGPELLRQISTQQSVFHRRQMLGLLATHKEPTERERALRYWASGLFDMNEDEHRRGRRLILPAFHRKRVETYRDQMLALAERMIDRWTLGEQRDMHADMVDLTMRIATSTLFGVDPDGVGDRVGHAIHSSLEAAFNPLAGLIHIDLPGFPYHHTLNLIGQIEAEMRRIIAEKQARGGDGGDVLSMLMQARDEEDGSTLSDDDLLAHAALLFIAGHETSSNALSWTLFLLSQHPHIAADLLDELTSVLHGDAPTVEQLRDLPLLDRVVKESMRILPPVNWNARLTAQETELGGYHIPAETEVIMSIYHTHHDAAIYSDPERFDPSRWERKEFSIFEYVPFSGGPRMCIGASFAMMEIKLVLALLLQRFRFELVPGARVDRLVTATMGLKHGLPMIVQEQDRQFHRGVGGARGNVREMVRLP